MGRARGKKQTRCGSLSGFLLRGVSRGVPSDFRLIQGVAFMGYFNELTFASGYYHIDAHGVVTLAPDTPPEIRERFWKVWPDFRKKVIALEKQGIYSSAYPYLPIEELDPNRNGAGRE